MGDWDRKKAMDLQVAHTQPVDLGLVMMCFFFFLSFFLWLSSQPIRGDVKPACFHACFVVGRAAVRLCALVFSSACTVSYELDPSCQPFLISFASVFFLDRYSRLTELFV